LDRAQTLAAFRRRGLHALGPALGSQL